MITGYPPFQSSTQDEIYRKVKDLNYAWPTDANFQNHVPEEAKNLVSSLLKVDAVERPEPDEIVGHEFFLMHNGDGIPGTLDSSCRRAKPSWLRQRHPIGDSMDPAARIPWTQICCQCGVGTKPGSVPFPVSGQYTATTIYKQCVEEEGEGRTPTVPIPEDMVYTSYPGPERWPPLLPPSVPDESFKINKAKGPSRKILKVVQTHAAAPLEQQLESKDFGQQIDVKLRPQAQAQDMKWPRPTERQSHAAQLRQKAQPLMSGRLPATRLRSTTTANPTVRSGQKSLVSAAEPATVRGLLTDLPIRRPSRSASTKSKLEPQSHNPVRLTRSHTAPGDISNESSDGKRVGQPLVTTTPVTLGTVVEEAHVRPTNERRTRSATTRGTPYVAVSDRSAGDSQTEKKHTYGQQSLNPRRAKTEYRSAGLSNSRQVLIGPDDDAEGLPFTASFSVSQALRRIFSNLGEALDKAPSGKKGKIDSEDLSSESIKDRPIVVKWVDYSNRHGVGYILDDGSVGCVFKSVIGDPPTCIVVRGGEEHLRKSKLVTDTKKHRIVPEDGQPVEFYENYGDGGIKRVLVQPAEFQMEVGPDGNVEKLNPGKDTFEFQKKKTVWMYHKFAKYMTQSSGKGEEDQGSPAHEGGKKNGKTVAKAFVKFYQRIGNVGVWGFGSGTFQVCHVSPRYKLLRVC